MTSESDTKDRRRGLRIDGEFLVRIVGLEDAPVRRRGNISVTGIYVEVEDYHGAPGTVERLEIASRDDLRHAVTLACLVRVTTVADLWEHERITGVAFHFLPGDEAITRALRQLVFYVARERLRGDEQLLEELGLSGAELNLGAGPVQPARLQTVRSSELVLETDWPVEKGARIGLAIEAPAARDLLRIRGVVEDTRALSDTPGQARYRVHVVLTEPDAPDLQAGNGSGRAVEVGVGADLEDAFGSLLDTLLEPTAEEPSMARAPHIEGDLARVSVASVLSLIEYEKMSGSLRLTSPDHQALVFVRDGRIVDAELEDSDDRPQQVLLSLVQWTVGSFRFLMEPVERPDLLRLTTTALLLDALREVDEADRP